MSNDRKDAAVMETNQERSAGTEGAASLSVLYVEDEQETREQMSHYLRRKVKSVVTAGDGEEGLDLFRQNPLDVVITDSRMPIMDGLTMVQKIREIKKDVRVLLVTAYTREELGLDESKDQVDYYINKPVDMRDLLGALRSIAQTL